MKLEVLGAVFDIERGDVAFAVAFVALLLFTFWAMGRAGRFR